MGMMMLEAWKDRDTCNAWYHTSSIQILFCPYKPPTLCMYLYFLLLQNLLLLIMSNLRKLYTYKEITDKLTVNWIMMRSLSRDQLWSRNGDEESEDVYQRMLNVHTKQRESEIIWAHALTLLLFLGLLVLYQTPQLSRDTLLISRTTAWFHICTIYVLN